MEPNPFPASRVCVHLWRIGHVHLCMRVLSSREDSRCPTPSRQGLSQNLELGWQPGSPSGPRVSVLHSRRSYHWPSHQPPPHTHLLTPYTLEEGGRQTNLIVGLNCLAELRILKIFIQNIKVWFGNQTVLIGTVLNKPHLLLSFYFF